MLAFSNPEEVKDYCKKIFRDIASNGGYILDAQAAIQQDAKIENVRALTESVFDFGSY